MNAEIARLGVDGVLLAVALTLAMQARTTSVRGRARRLQSHSGSSAAASSLLAERIRRAVRRRGITAEPGQLLAGWVLALIAAAAVGSAVDRAWSVAASAAVVAAGPIAWRWAGQRAERARAAAVPATLDHVARELRAGATVESALADLAARDGPVAGDLRALGERARLVGWAPALRSWDGRARPRSPMRAFTTVAASGLAVATDVGGPAADALDALAHGLRDERDRALEARALATQGRLSAMVVGLAPVGSLLVASALDDRTARLLVTTDAGWVCLVVGLALDALAAWWMHRIVAAVG